MCVHACHSACVGQRTTYGKLFISHMGPRGRAQVVRLVNKAFMCVRGLSICMCIYLLCTWSLWRSEEGIGSPGTGV